MRSPAPALLALLLLILAACSDGAPGASPDPGASASPAPSSLEASFEPMASGAVQAALCAKIAELEASVVELRAIELRIVNRVALDIQLDAVGNAFAAVEESESGSLEEQLEAPLRRLGYGLIELELAVEDFRTNSRPRRAVPHVQEDAESFADELAAFAILARC